MLARLAAQMFILSWIAGCGGRPSVAPETTAPRREAVDGGTPPAEVDPVAARHAAMLTVSAGDAEAERGSSPEADLAAEIAGVRAEATRGRAGGGTAVRGSGDAPATVGGADRTTPVGRVALTSQRAFDESSLTAELVTAKVRAAYLAGVRRCYQDALPADPEMRGRVTLAFTVDASGRARAAKASGLTPAVESCLTELIGGWRFAAPVDVDGEPTDASFEIVLLLVPE